MLTRSSGRPKHVDPALRWARSQCTSQGQAGILHAQAAMPSIPPINHTANHFATSPPASIHADRRRGNAPPHHRLELARDRRRRCGRVILRTRRRWVGRKRAGRSFRDLCAAGVARFATRNRGGVRCDHRGAERAPADIPKDGTVPQHDVDLHASTQTEEGALEGWAPRDKARAAYTWHS